MRKIIYSTAIAVMTSNVAQAAEHQHYAVTPNNSNFSISYDYMLMNMSDNLDGTNKVTDTEIFADGFDMSPQKMTTQTHSVTAAYKVGQRTSISASVPYIQKDMDMLMDTGDKMKMKSEGVGDTTIQTNFDVTGDKSVQAYFGLSLPTGAVDKADDGTRLGYSMQTGTGTYDPSIGMQYSQSVDGWSYGAGANATMRFGENDQDYRFGNEYGVSAFVGRQMTQAVSASWRVDAKSRGNIGGADAALDPMMDPTQDGKMQGGEVVTTSFGLAYSPQQGGLKGSTLASEFAVPVYQNLDGPQLADDYHFMLSLKKDL